MCEELNRKWKYNGGVLLGWDRAECLEVAELQRRWGLVDDVRGLLECKRGFVFTLGGDHLCNRGRVACELRLHWPLYGKGLSVLKVETIGKYPFVIIIKIITWHLLCALNMLCKLKGAGHCTSAKRITSILRHVAEAFPPDRQGHFLLLGRGQS